VVRVASVVNGEHRDLRAETHQTLAEVLCHEAGLTSVHVDCEDGTCGACTVHVDDEAIRSCLMLAVQAKGAHVRTAEGLGPRWQAVLRDEKAACEVCVPGLVMLAATEPEPERLRPLLAANVCRRAGHEQAREAVIRAAPAADGTRGPQPARLPYVG
jgi:aerobic-type carbon monoxide dehydrogenase small subunit (CoxS/CutS family)